MVLGDARLGKFSENVMGFARMLRRAGLRVDTDRIRLAQMALAQIDMGNKVEVRSALECTLVSHYQDRDVFNQLFEAYFKDPEIARQLLAQLLPQSKAAKSPPRRSPRAQEALQFAQQIQRNTASPPREEIKLDAAMSASDRQRLRHADFDSLNASEYRLVDRLAREIALDLPTFRSRRIEQTTRGHRVHWPSLMRDMARHDGDVIDLTLTRSRREPLPLLILVDISGSMERYARLLLAFLHQATRGQRRSVFAFGTELTDLNLAFRHDDTDAMLRKVNEEVPDFGGGTQISRAIETLRNQHRSAIIGNRTIVLLISDGLDTGDPDQLEAPVRWLCQQSRRTVWLNPLLRYKGYQPLAAGAQVLARYVDRMLAIHNLERLESLAQAMRQLLYNPGRTHRPRVLDAKHEQPHIRVPSADGALWTPDVNARPRT